MTNTKWDRTCKRGTNEFTNSVQGICKFIDLCFPRDTYIWPIAQAMPYLFGKETTSRIHCLATDAEPALIDAIRLGTTTKNGYASFIKHRLDCYHMFIQKWTDDISITCNMSVNLQTSLNDLRGWIHSWFKTIETNSEYKYSRREFDIVFNELKLQNEIKPS